MKKNTNFGYHSWKSKHQDERVIFLNIQKPERERGREGGRERGTEEGLPGNYIYQKVHHPPTLYPNEPDTSIKIDKKTKVFN